MEGDWNSQEIELKSQQVPSINANKSFVQTMLPDFNDDNYQQQFLKLMHQNQDQILQKLKCSSYSTPLIVGKNEPNLNVIYFPIYIVNDAGSNLNNLQVSQLYQFQSHLPNNLHLAKFSINSYILIKQWPIGKMTTIPNCQVEQQKLKKEHDNYLGKYYWRFLFQRQTENGNQFCYSTNQFVKQQDQQHGYFRIDNIDHLNIKNIGFRIRKKDIEVYILVQKQLRYILLSASNKMKISSNKQIKEEYKRIIKNNKFRDLSIYQIFQHLWKQGFKGKHSQDFWYQNRQGKQRKHFYSQKLVNNQKQFDNRTQTLLNSQGSFFDNCHFLGALKAMSHLDSLIQGLNLIQGLFEVQYKQTQQVMYMPKYHIDGEHKIIPVDSSVLKMKQQNNEEQQKQLGVSNNKMVRILEKAWAYLYININYASWGGKSNQSILLLTGFWSHTYYMHKKEQRFDQNKLKLTKLYQYFDDFITLKKSCIIIGETDAQSQLQQQELANAKMANKHSYFLIGKNSNQKYIWMNSTTKQTNNYAIKVKLSFADIQKYFERIVICQIDSNFKTETELIYFNLSIPNQLTRFKFYLLTVKDHKKRHLFNLLQRNKRYSDQYLNYEQTKGKGIQYLQKQIQIYDNHNLFIKNRLNNHQSRNNLCFTFQTDRLQTQRSYLISLHVKVDLRYKQNPDPLLFFTVQSQLLPFLQKIGEQYQFINNAIQLIKPKLKSKRRIQQLKNHNQIQFEIKNNEEIEMELKVKQNCQQLIQVKCNRQRYGAKYCFKLEMRSKSDQIITRQLKSNIMIAQQFKKGKYVFTLRKIMDKQILESKNKQIQHSPQIQIQIKGKTKKDQGRFAMNKFVKNQGNEEIQDYEEINEEQEQNEQKLQVDQTQLQIYQLCFSRPRIFN